ncbi:hypothetical protein RHDC4_01413 [Rhodocyclaceae bacterium]|nr:hypothetical protein RHDC4_01413 [Rhodocyclaceae bacterium]
MLVGVPALTKAALYSAAFLFLASACANLDAFGGSRAAVVAWGAERGLAPEDMDSGRFRLLTLSRRTGPTDVLTVYIEGDGAPWPTPYHPPRDPTPVKPVALALAAADPAAAVVYLGRPCQYLAAAELAACDPALWISRRFAPEIVVAYDDILSRLKARTGAARLRLVGYSGGGVVAALLALRRADVAEVVTVAAPLALADWTRHHGITALTGSLDPLRETGPLPQGVHWVGGRDKTVPPAIVAGFVARKGGRLATMPDFDHECCWTRDWPTLLSRSRKEEMTP